ncbi:MAG: hypothetical protein CVV44_18755 [Spirochaetae bacterium HGW-Spirochaetae-1]|jgi:hypothetical protein|nr:MAG: hypothetical protein CVV44_18755 [Spirochaetae bacterium HGW-Spirochaetae-1]
MKKIALTILLIPSLIIAVGNTGPSRAAQKITMHFFFSGICPSCKQAKKDMPDIQKQFPSLMVVTHEVRNSQGIVTAANNVNIKKLIDMLSEMDRSSKGEPFIYEGGKAYPFLLDKGIPCYRKKISESTTLTKEIPVPVFILGGKVLLGYQRHILQRELVRLAGGK